MREATHRDQNTALRTPAGWRVRGVGGWQLWSERASDVQTTDDSLGWAEAARSADGGAWSGEDAEDAEGGEGEVDQLLSALASTRVSMGGSLSLRLAGSRQLGACSDGGYAEDFEEYDGDDCDVNLVSPPHEARVHGARLPRE